jgi:hypothetical protein
MRWRERLHVGRGEFGYTGSNEYADLLERAEEWQAKLPKAEAVDQ